MITETHLIILIIVWAVSAICVMGAFVVIGNAQNKEREKIREDLITIMDAINKNTGIIDQTLRITSMRIETLENKEQS